MRGEGDIVAGLAAVQYGRVARTQLLERGIAGWQVDRWLAQGRLLVVHRGVYAVGHLAPSIDGGFVAAVLAGGPGAVLSHRAAAWRLGLLRNRRAPRAEITVPTTADRGRPGIVVHRVRDLHPLDVSVLDGIPIVTVPRALLDIAPTTGPDDLARACHEAWVRHRAGPDAIEACIARNPRRPGAARLRAAIGADVTLSVLEQGFLALLDRHGIARPRTNVDRRGDKVDCHWPALDLTVELLSFRFHATRRAFEADVARRRRSAHVAFTYGDVFERGPATVADLRRRLELAARRVRDAR